MMTRTLTAVVRSLGIYNLDYAQTQTWIWFDFHERQRHSCLSTYTSLQEGVWVCGI